MKSWGLFSVAELVETLLELKWNKYMFGESEKEDSSAILWWNKKQTYCGKNPSVLFIYSSS